ncbi:glycoside hydrolase family 9 protein [Cellulomonas fimi]|uniref:Endoglucanase n=1 Tax=Cellulomonas fimi (strain ATCC 484 / DSM 20113 / JCM 1341 / CCUG 24087 / LMG 16345 / NBRC 15513 / NCIMB 8980 / NCTC 7547 / NRS-133) TaxID=590998 RepID=F4H6I3_CELFA|nr:glycoside hydrolase family 9 protein [Cellulomonas fimi]AEE45616.1 glycoside hydrolase family 9 [Cellulomonas fimi ATCC 484]VEH30079.1 Endoglucanase C precursor [Cellulomonas fimi]
MHTLHLDDVHEPGAGYVLEADGATSDPFAIGGDLWDGLRVDSLVVFYGQRSGIPIEEDLLGAGYGRAAGHVDVAPNGGDGDVACLPAGHATTAAGVDLYEGWTGGYALDVTGGWYDAGDQGKYVVNGGIAVAQLLGLYERALRTGTAGALGDGSLRVPESGDGVPDVLSEARWELEWMLRMVVPEGEPLAGLVHHKVSDERWVPLPMLPADDPQPRFLHRPSTAATLNLAAVAAQGSRLFAPHDAAFADRLLAAARAAYDAAQAHPVLLAPDTNTLENAGSGPYDDTDVDDDRLWAATELYLSTGEDRYAADLRANPYRLGGTAPAFRPEGFDWNHVAAWARLQLATVDSALPERALVRASVVDAADALVEAQATQPFGHPYVPTSGRYDWGSNGLLLNNLAVLAAAHEITGDDRYRDAVLGGVDYVFGRNALGVSYVTGYGTRDVRNQHSRWYAHQLDPALPHPPRGTVSGGPNSDCPDPVSAALAGSPAQCCFVDDVGAYGVNEMTINWNSALAWVAAYLAGLGDGRPSPAAEG